eukprot:TRINITY_DN479_c0_g2_i1.p1 TRINITY_DN479_c0_g2~~TRINITY_DN479_c0_g2_i1.p1  ORF type:complete len:230 (-),score=93.59 TRINITY_DN479_c0_g2_i1:65-754(-)
MIEMRETLAELDANPACKGIILRSAQPKIFSGGLDIMALHAPPRDELALFWTALQDMWMTFFGLGTPTYAAINGASPAGGCLLAMCCDERGMLANAGVIGLNETHLGIVAPEIMFAQPFARLIGERAAERHLQLGTLMSPSQAQQLGLVDELFDTEDELMAHAVKTLEQYARLPADARAMSKRVLRGPLIRRMEQEREGELRMVIDLLLSDTVQANIGAYLASLKARKK